ncbi:MAG TPA: pyridine nucleotide-disulfide oxidoreductase, partial [Chitinophagaceae bacterium]
GFLQPLPLGGFGVSRYKLDAAMALIAKHWGVEIREQVKVNEVQYRSGLFCIDTNADRFKAPVCCGAFGKRSNLDVKWKRRFIQKQAGALDNYIGIKYHAYLDQPRDIIALHNFKNGYCGISAIEEDKYCICYLTTASNLRDNYNDIKRMEEALLFKNPHLERIFTNATFLYKEPLAISRISFDKKQQVENHVLMAGDAAGMIAPLCGNGMSMALHAGKLAAQCIRDFLESTTDRTAMETRYRQQWKHLFGSRLRTGRMIQRLFGNARVANLFIQAISPFPRAIRLLVRHTHGDAF